MYGQPSKRRRIKPFARPTSFDYNCRFDIRQYQDVKYNNTVKPFFQAASNEEVFRVMEGELLVSKRKQLGYHDKELHCFSFCNGLSPAPEAQQDAFLAAAGIDANSPSKTLNENSATVDNPNIRMAILAGLRYVGVAVTEFSPSRDVYEQGFVATIAGLNTIYNNGKNNIFPGQTLCLDLPVVRGNQQGAAYKRALQAGIPQDKLQFVVTPLDQFIAGEANGGSGYTDARQRLMRVNGLRFNPYDYVIGTAISYARPGDNVDIILHRVNHMSTGVNGGGGGEQGGEEQGGGDNGGDGGNLAVPVNNGGTNRVKKKKSKKSDSN
jgi:hypothetical protein